MELSKGLVDAVARIWQQIAPDAEDYIDPDHDRVTQIVEACVDCDRMNPIMGVQEDFVIYAEFTLAKSVYGYHAVVEELAKNPRLNY